MFTVDKVNDYGSGWFHWVIKKDGKVCGHADSEKEAYEIIEEELV